MRSLTHSSSPGSPGRRRIVLHLSAVAFTAEKLLLPQLRHLQGEGYDVRIACAADAAGYPPSLVDFAPIDVRFPRSLRPLGIIRATLHLLAVLRRLRPDILHLHTPAAAVPARLLPRALLPPTTRICYTVHGYAHTWSEAPRDRLLRQLERRLAPRADVTLYQSREDLESANAKGFSGRLAYLGNGVEDEWFDIAPPVRSGDLKLLFIGRIVEEKGILELLDAVEGCDGVELRIAGGQLLSDRDGVEDVVRRRVHHQRTPGRVTLLGMLSRDALRQQLAASDAVVLPSHREGVPRSLIEGMAAGRPAVATSIRGCRELVTDGRDGLLVPTGDFAALRAAIERLRDLPAEEFAAWSERARSRMWQSHRERDVLIRLSAVYADLLVEER